MINTFLGQATFDKISLALKEAWKFYNVGEKHFSAMELHAKIVKMTVDDHNESEVITPVFVFQKPKFINKFPPFLQNHYHLWFKFPIPFKYLPFQQPSYAEMKQ